MRLIKLIKVFVDLLNSRSVFPKKITHKITFPCCRDGFIRFQKQLEVTFTMLEIIQKQIMNWSNSLGVTLHDFKKNLMAGLYTTTRQTIIKKMIKKTQLQKIQHTLLHRIRRRFPRTLLRRRSDRSRTWWNWWR